jgi:hypothetical protein
MLRFFKNILADKIGKNEAIFNHNQGDQIGRIFHILGLLFSAVKVMH